MTMTVVGRTIVVVASLAIIVGCAWAGVPVNNIQVTLRGKKYEVPQVETVKQLQDVMQEESGLDPKQQGRVLFGGKRLLASDVLSDVGVTDGAKLNFVPAGKTKNKSATASSSGTSSAAGTASTTTKEPSGSDAAADGSSYMNDMLKKAGVDPNQMNEMMKGMGGSGGEGGGMPDMKESLDMMSNMMNSPIFQEYMSDPDKLEQSRQMILQNPMLKSMMTGMPGMEELLNSPEAWKEAMQAAADMYKNMDANDLMKAMMQQGAGGGGGGTAAPGMGGLFDGMDGSSSSSSAASLENAATTAALDELSEGED